MVYRWMFNLARWFALEAHIHAPSIADEYICAETRSLPTQAKRLRSQAPRLPRQAPLHGADRCRDPLQSLGHPRLGSAPVQRAQRRSDRRRERRGT